MDRIIFSRYCLVKRNKRPIFATPFQDWFQIPVMRVIGRGLCSSTASPLFLLENQNDYIFCYYYFLYVSLQNVFIQIIIWLISIQQ